MRLCRIAALALLVCSNQVLAQNPPAQNPPANQPAVAYNGICEQGNVSVTVPGTPGSGNQKFQQSYPRCTIDVYQTGTTTRAPIFSNANRAVLANPFTADVSGRFRFFADAGTYDVRLSGAGIPQPFTIASITLGNVNTGGGNAGMNCGLIQIEMDQIAACAERNGGVAYPQWWGAKADGVILGGVGGGTGCNGNVGSAVVTCSAGRFTAADTGKRFDFAHAGTPQCGPRVWARGDLLMDCNLVGTIQSVQSATQATLSTNLLRSVTNEQFAYASSDDRAVQEALDSGIKTIALVGTYGITGSVTNPALGNGMVGGVFINRAVTAAGPGAGRLLRIGPVAWDGYAGTTFVVENGTQSFSMDGVSIWGTNAAGELTAFGPTHDGLLICSGSPNAQLCSGLPGNSNGSITDIRFLNVDMSHTWGIGFHQPGVSGGVGAPGVYNLLVSHSLFTYNAYDGMNPNVTDGTIINAVNASYNGTGGLELATMGGAVVTGSIFSHNKSTGIALGGFQGGATGRACSITGNEMNDNGNGSPPEAAGIGLIIGDGVQNCTITGNTIRHNHHIGMLVGSTSIDRHYLISGNIVSTNGLRGDAQLSMGIYGNFSGVTLTGNQVVNEAYGDIRSIGRTNNIVTVQTANAVNYYQGYTVTISGSPNGVFDGTGTVISRIDGATFTFNEPGPDIPVQIFQPGITPLGWSFSDTGGFNQREGMVVQFCNKTEITNNIVRYHDYANVSFIQFEPGYYVGCLFSSDENTTALWIPQNPVSNPDGNYRDFYPATVPPGQGAAPLIPKIGSFVANIPSMQLVTQACTTPATVGATCNVVINHGFNGALDFQLSTPSQWNRLRTTCTLDNDPVPQAGTPEVLKVVQSSFYQATITIGTFDGQAAGGGTMKCVTNYNY